MEAMKLHSIPNKRLKLSMRAINVRDRCNHAGYGCREMLKSGEITKIRGAGRVVIAELRKLYGLKPETIKRCKCCGQVVK